jgi:hypothetical protein
LLWSAVSSINDANDYGLVDRTFYDGSHRLEIKKGAEAPLG